MSDGIFLVEKFKRPNATLDYLFDWDGEALDGGPWLQEGDTISTSTWTVPAGLTKTTDSKTDTTTTVWLTGGTVGNSYDCINQITTAAGRVQEAILRITVRNK